MTDKANQAVPTRWFHEHIRCSDGWQEEQRPKGSPLPDRSTCTPSTQEIEPRRNFSTRTLALGIAAIAITTGSQAGVVESWDFENATSPSAIGGVPTDGFSFTDTTRGEANGSNGTLGVNNTLLRGFNLNFGPQFDSDRVVGGNFALDTVDNSGDAYVTEGALHNWTAPNWSLTLNVYLDAVDGWETIVGRDGSSVASNESDFYLQRVGGGSSVQKLRLNYVDNDGTRHILESDQSINTGQWYDIGIVVDSGNDTVSMYIDGELEAQLTGLTGDLGVAQTNLNWTFGRGWFNNIFVDSIDGSLDDITFYDEAIVIPEPGSLALLGMGSLFVAARRRRK